jgi:oligosaccharide repeat unit polymerase
MANLSVTDFGIPRRSNGTLYIAAAVRERRLASATVGLVFAAWAATVLLHEVNIGGRWDFVTTSTWLLIIGWIFAFSFGGIIGVRSGSDSAFPPQEAMTESIGRWMLILCFVTFAGISLFVFDFAILRGYGFTTAAATIRLEEVQAAVGGTTTSSPVSGVGRLLIPAFLPACILFVMYRARLTKAVTIAFFVTVLFTFVEQVLFEGGRWFITTVVVAMLVSFLLRRGTVDQNGNVHKRGLPIIRLVVLSGFLLSFFAYVFIERVVQRSDYFASAYMQLASSYRLTINYDQLGMFEGPLGGLWFTVCMLWLYATQGFNELDLILQQRYLDHAHGLYQVPQIGQIILLLTGIDVRYDALANLPTYGSYATFYGHSYVDFGNAGSIFFAFGMGYVTARAVRGFAAGRMSALSMMAPALATLCMFSPIVSLVPTLWPALIWLGIAGAALAPRLSRVKATPVA